MQSASLNVLPYETLQLIAHHVLNSDNNARTNAWVALAGVCSSLRHAVVGCSSHILPLQAHIPISHRSFDTKIAALELINVANVTTLVLHLGRTSWLTDDEYTRVTSNFAHLHRGRPFVNMQPRVLAALRHLTIESLSRHMWYMPAIATLAAHIPNLRRLRLDVKPGGPPSATDNLVLPQAWRSLEALHVEYDWTKDDLEYSPCLRLDAEGCTSLTSLRVGAVDKPANLLALSLPPAVCQLELVCEPVAHTCWSSVLRCPGLRGASSHVSLKVGPEAALALNAALAEHSGCFGTCDLVLPPMVGSWLEDGLWLPPARHLHVTCLGHHSNDSIDVRGLQQLLEGQVLESLWLVAPHIGRLPELLRCVDAHSPRYKAVETPGVSCARALLNVFRVPMSKSGSQASLS